MARRVSRRSKHELFINKWWVSGILSLILLALGAWFISLAHDSGDWWEYVLTVLLIAWALNRAVRSVQAVSDR